MSQHGGQALTLSIQMFGRAVKPVASALVLSMLVISWSAWSDHGVLTTSSWADVLGTAAAVTAAVLLYGWVVQSQRFAEIGLAFAFFVWCVRFLLILTVRPVVITQEGFLLAFAWCVVAGGAYLLERRNTQYQRTVLARESPGGP